MRLVFLVVFLSFSSAHFYRVHVNMQYPEIHFDGVEIEPEHYHIPEFGTILISFAVGLVVTSHGQRLIIIFILNLSIICFGFRRIGWSIKKV